MPRKGCGKQEGARFRDFVSSRNARVRSRTVQRAASMGSFPARREWSTGSGDLNRRTRYSARKSGSRKRLRRGTGRGGWRRMRLELEMMLDSIWQRCATISAVDQEPGDGEVCQRSNGMVSAAVRKRDWALKSLERRESSFGI